MGPAGRLARGGFILLLRHVAEWAWWLLIVAQPSYLGGHDGPVGGGEFSCRTVKIAEAAVTPEGAGARGRRSQRALERSGGVCGDWGRCEGRLATLEGSEG